MVSTPRGKFMNLISEKYSIHWLLFLFSVLLYFNSWTNYYTFGDELVTTEANSNVQLGAEGLKKIFNADGQSWFEFIPLTASTFILEYELVGFYTPLGNIIQILLFALCVVLIYVFLGRTFSQLSVPVRFAMALMFMVHPVHTSVVNDFGGRADILGLVFFLLSALQVLKWNMNEKARHLAGASVLSFLALLSDPSYVHWLVIPVCLMLSKKSKMLRKSAAVFMAYFIPLFIYSAWRFGKTTENTIEAINNPLILIEGTPTFLSSACANAGIYLKQLIFPYPLCSIYGYGQLDVVSWNDYRVWLSLLGYACLVFMFLLFFRKKPVVAIGALIILIDLIPGTNILYLQSELLDEKVLFGSTLGFTMILGSVFQVVLKLDRQATLRDVYRSNRIAKSVIGGFILIQCYSVVIRNFDWITSYSLARVDVENHPNSAKLHYLRATTTRNEYTLFPNRSKEKQIEIASYHYSQAIKIYPDWDLPKLELGYLYLNDKNQPSEAMMVFRTALSLDSLNVKARIGLARALAANKENGMAIENFAKVLESEPNNKEALNQIISLYFVEEHLEGAQLFNQRFFQFHPNFFEPYVHQGNLHLAEGDTLRALAYFEDALTKKGIEPGFSNYVKSLRSVTTTLSQKTKPNTK